MNSKTKSQILEELGGISEEVYNSLVAEFYQQVADQVKNMNGLIKQADWSTLMVEAHSIKGAAANLRLNDAMEAARAMETAVKAGEYERLPSILQRLESSGAAG